MVDFVSKRGTRGFDAIDPEISPPFTDTMNDDGRNVIGDFGLVLAPVVRIGTDNKTVVRLGILVEIEKYFLDNLR